MTDCYIRTAADESAVKAAFGDVKAEKVGNALVFFTGKRTEKEINEKLAALGADFLKLRVLA